MYLAALDEIIDFASYFTRDFARVYFIKFNFFKKIFKHIIVVQMPIMLFTP